MDYSKLKPPTSKDKKPIVLFYNGTFAPIHDGNYNNLYIYYNL